MRSRAPAALALVAAAVALGGSSRPAAAIPRSAPPAPIPWARLRNPILRFPGRATKDPALVTANGRWYALFSSVDASGRWSVGISSSRDLRHWSRQRSLPHDPAVEGEASPDVSRAPDGTFVVTYQSFVHDRDGGEAKLYARTTTDFRRFSGPRPLTVGGRTAPAERLIDPALVWSPAGLLLGYKVGGTDTGQAFEIARSAGGTLDGPWEVIGRPDISVLGDTIENYQFLHVDGRWRLLATSNNFDRPYLFDVAGDTTDPAGWLHWSAGRQLEIPLERRWNPGTGATGATYEHANCAFLVDGRGLAGHFYLVYSDSPEKRTLGGEGPASLGIARSTDLAKWTVPPR